MSALVRRWPRSAQAWSTGDVAGILVLLALATLALVVLVAPLAVMVLVSFDALE